MNTLIVLHCQTIIIIIVIIIIIIIIIIMIINSDNNDSNSKNTKSPPPIQGLQKYCMNLMWKQSKWIKTILLILFLELLTT